MERIYHEKGSGNIVLNEMIDYARAGDIIFVYSIDSLGKNVKAIIRFIMLSNEKNITLYIKREKFDSTSQFGIYALGIIESLDKISNKHELMERADAPNEKGRIPRELSDLSAYMKLVEKNEITVTEVCRRLNIGRTTYYRRCKELDDIITDEIEEVQDETI